MMQRDFRSRELSEVIIASRSRTSSRVAARDRIGARRGPSRILVTHFATTLSPPRAAEMLRTIRRFSRVWFPEWGFLTVGQLDGRTDRCDHFCDTGGRV